MVQQKSGIVPPILTGGDYMRYVVRVAASGCMADSRASLRGRVARPVACDAAVAIDACTVKSCFVLFGRVTHVALSASRSSLSPH